MNANPRREAGEHVDVVVVGSGFGGAVAAYRLAAAGLSVVVLERGRTYPPGGFPRSPAELGKAFWDPKEGLLGMFEVWSFDELDAVVASGLGGGSLIYANVLLRKDEHWFVTEEPEPGGGSVPWPVTRAELDPHYDAVEEMLGATPYPLDRPGYADTPKTIALRDAAVELGLDWRLPPLAISFAPSPGAEPGPGLPVVPPAYGNLHGRPRLTCRLCGECDLGCNDGAKNTLDHTYLSAASQHGADLRTLHEARTIRPRPGGGYTVGYIRHDTVDVEAIGCSKLVLAAGTLGTSYLLLRNRSALPGLSDTLGSRFSGNGDLLTFLLRAKDRSRTRLIDPSRGPVITSAIRLPDDLDGVPGTGRGGYIEDGGFPASVGWLIEGTDLGHEFGRAARFLVELLLARIKHDSNLSAELSRLIGDGELSDSSMPLLGMGRDVPDGQLRLRGGNLDLRWSSKASEAYFDRLRATLRRISDVLGAEHSELPGWLGKRFMTVHPLGGAPMGRHRGEGVCDGYGEVFDQPGLFIADGAAMPGPVGTNPSLTIAALADRMCTRLLEHRPPPAVRRMPPPRPPAEPTALSFTEEMAGLVPPATGEPPGAAATPSPRDRLAIRLTVRIDDVDRFLVSPEHPAGAEGWIEAARFGGRVRVERAWVNIFAPGAGPDRREIRYRLWFTDAAGRPRTLTGRKDVRDGPLTRVWPDTTTLHVRLLRGHVTEDDDDTATVDGTGILTLKPVDLAATIGSLRTRGPHGIGGLVRFGRFFVGQLWDRYGPG